MDFTILAVVYLCVVVPVLNYSGIRTRKEEE